MRSFPCLTTCLFFNLALLCDLCLGYFNTQLKFINKNQGYTYFNQNPQSNLCQYAKVALTREEEKNWKLKELLDQEQIESIEIPCICHERDEGFDKLLEVLKSSEGYDYVIITSPEAAHVFLTCWEQAGKANGLKFSIASVGSATSQALIEGGLHPSFEPSKSTAEVLASELPLKGECKVLYPASSLARPTLERGLSARGFSVTRMNTYNTLPAEWTETMLNAAKEVSIVTFASPSAVKTWTERVGNSKIAACIGETSAAACRSEGWEQVFSPAKPGMKGWMEAIKQAVEKQTQTSLL